jgi:F-type H+-transporting ATPase subunit gamma
MPTVKEYNDRLSRLRGTRKITQTMKLVSANSLRRFQRAQTELSRFLGAFEAALAPVLAASTTADHPLLTQPPKSRRVLILLITSDMGLCGGFNNSLARFVHEWISSQRAHGALEVAISLCGRRGRLIFRDEYPVHSRHEQISRKPTLAHAHRLAAEMQEAFLAGEYDTVYLAYNLFRNVMSQTPTFELLLPISIPSPAKPAGEFADRMLEPAPAVFLETLLPKLVTFRIFSALLHSATSENAARMTTMDSSTANVDRLIDHYILLRNRARQAAITRELNEIIAGAESLAEAV